MSDFKYESVKPIIPKKAPENWSGELNTHPDIEITAARFLVPIRVKVTLHGSEHEIGAHIDYVNKEVFVGNQLASPNFHEKLFAFLHIVTNPSGEQYQASAEIQDEILRAEEAKQQFEQQKDEYQ